MADDLYLQYDNPWWPKESTYPNARVQTRTLDKSVNRMSTRVGGLEFVYYEGLNPVPNKEPKPAPGKSRNEEQSIDDQIKDQKEKEKNPPLYTPVNIDRSYALLQDKFGALLRLSGGNAMFKATSSMTIAAAQDMHVESHGHHQLTIGRDSNEYRIGNSRFLFGRQDAQHLEHMTNIHKETQSRQMVRLGLLLNGVPDKCPVCRTPLLVDMYSVYGAPVGYRSSLHDYNSTDHVKARILQKYNTFTFSPVARTSLEARLKKEGCGSPSCKAGDIMCYEQGNVSASQYGPPAGASMIEPTYINELKMGQGTDTAYAYSGDVTTRIGLLMNNLPCYVQTEYHLIPFNFVLPPPSKQLKATRAGLILSTALSTGRMTYAEPPISAQGSWTIEVGQKMITTVGLSYDLIVSSKAYIKAAGIEIAATQGEAIFSSNNITCIRGDNVMIEARGIHVSADSTFVAGAFNVSGDSAFKGHLTLDGAISCPYLIMPSMSQTSSFAGSSKFIDHKAYWDTPPSKEHPNHCNLVLQKKKDGNGDIEDYRVIEKDPTTGSAAFVSAVKQLLYDMNFKYKFKFDWWQYKYGMQIFAKDIAYIIDLVMSPVEDAPTGFTSSEPTMVKSFCPAMHALANNPDVQAANPAVKDYQDGMTPGYTMPNVTGFVFNFKHHHARWGEAHDHESAMPVGSYTQSTYDWGFERTAGSASATPHPIKGDGLMYGRGAKGWAKSAGFDTFESDEEVDFLVI